jgi:geranylgeranyl diphosphate synthase type II
LNTLELEFLHKTIEQKLSELIEGETELHRAARYSLLSPGKRLRPLLTLTTALSLGATLESALIPACALELVHTYSLIHDDLPSMDNDDFRRGKPSLHKAYTEGHAVLTGDYLLTYAFQLLSEAPHLTAEQKIALVQFLSIRAGDRGMIGGQVLDIASQESDIDLETLHHIHLGKTAALIALSLEFGGIIAHSTPQEMHLLNVAGKNLGIAFQIIDDLLDGDTEGEESTNILSHMDKEAAQTHAHTLFNSAHQSLSLLPHPTSTLQQLTHKLIFRTS